MQLEIGTILDGKITSVKKFGAFVMLPENKIGMVHVSEISSEYIKELNDVLKEGQLVKVKIVNINPEGKIALSIKQATENSSYKTKSTRADTGIIWQPKQKPQITNLSFEEMMAKFKTQSEENICDLKRVTETRRNGYSKRR